MEATRRLPLLPLLQLLSQSIQDMPLPLSIIMPLLQLIMPLLQLTMQLQLTMPLLFMLLQLTMPLLSMLLQLTMPLLLPLQLTMPLLLLLQLTIPLLLLLQLIMPQLLLPQLTMPLPQPTSLPHMSKKREPLNHTPTPMLLPTTTQALTSMLLRPPMLMVLFLDLTLLLFPMAVPRLSSIPLTMLMDMLLMFPTRVSQSTPRPRLTFQPLSLLTMLNMFE